MTKSRGVRSGLSPNSVPRIGIYAGSFDPVHAGHISFALRALKSANLDRIYFMPEREPRGKSVEHYGHRVAMISRALRPYGRLEVLETVEKCFTVRRTVIHLRQKFPDSSFIFLLGSDVAQGLHMWPHAQDLMKISELCIALRAEDGAEDVLRAIQKLPLPPLKLRLVEGMEKEISSSAIRRAIAVNQKALGLLKSVYQYARREWLYTHR